MGPVNSRKNKLNSEIIFIFHLNPNAHYVSVWIQLIVASAFLSCGFLFFFFLVQPTLVDFSTMNSAFVHYLRTHKFHFSATFSLKIGPTALFTHLKIILLQCFQFQFSVSAKISSIQMDAMYY